ncbi:helix-turn-helix transcriptional regulator [Caldifermentibacillus hisashii]|uniref:helix-turn-helix domain-containing protein n=1 Tax=Caldifermentibacillus hisashii TaxID=996558 RepID=UPI0031FE0D91
MIKRSRDALDELYTPSDEEEEREPLRIVLKIGEVLKTRGMTQKELAELTGIRPSAISVLARGYIERLNLDHVERIANALNIEDINELISLEPESEAQQYSR